MSLRPAPFFVRFRNNRPDGAVDEEDPWRLFDSIEFPTRRKADHFADLKRAAGRYAAVYGRVNIRDVTPAGDPAGLLWDSEDRLLDEG